MDTPTKHEDFHHVGLHPSMLAEVLLYFGALEFGLLAVLGDVLLKAQSHTHLRTDSASGVGTEPSRTHRESLLQTK